MLTQQSTGTLSFPAHDIDPSEKNTDWCLQFCRAIYNNGVGHVGTDMFYPAREYYRILKNYGLSKQDTMQYRKFALGDEASDTSFVAIDYGEPPTIGSKYRNIVINKLIEREFNIVCTPIDPLSVDATNKQYAEMKAKVIMRDALQKTNPQLLNSPAVQRHLGDPESLEDFAMKDQLGFKTRIAMDAELGIEVVFEQGNIAQERMLWIEDLVDIGVGVCRDYTEDDKACFERVYPGAFLCNPFLKKDGSDIVYGAQIKRVKLSELAEYFDFDEMKRIAGLWLGQEGNPSDLGYNFTMGDAEKYYVLVVDAEWLSYNTDVYRRHISERGNYSFKKTRYKRRYKDEDDMIEIKGNQKPRYERDVTEVVYVAKWVIGTEFVYDEGLQSNMKRRKSEYKKASLSYHVYVPDFFEMRALGIMERLKPLIDDYCNTYFKIQNFKNKWIPYIINIDLDAIENVPLGKGGKKLTPKQNLEMLAQTFTIATRKHNLGGVMDQGKPVNIETTQMAQELVVLAGELQAIIQRMRDVTGINEALDATGPAERTTVIAQQQAQQGSNNAINHFAMADSRLLEALADASLLRLQRILKNGKNVSGYVTALGTQMVKFVQISPDISRAEYAIKLEDRPNVQERNELLQMLSMKDQQGLIQPEDYFMIRNMRNLKEAELYFIYTSKKRKDEAQANAQANTQQTGQVQMQSAQAAEQAKQQTLQVEYQLKGNMEAMLKDKDFQRAEMEKKYDLQAKQMDGNFKTASTVIQAGASKGEQIDQHAHEKSMAAMEAAQGEPAEA